MADHVGLATASADGDRQPIIEGYDQLTPKSASRTDWEGFTAQVIRQRCPRQRPARDPERLKAPEHDAARQSAPNASARQRSFNALLSLCRMPPSIVLQPAAACNEAEAPDRPHCGKSLPLGGPHV